MPRVLVAHGFLLRWDAAMVETSGELDAIPWSPPVKVPDPDAFGPQVNYRSDLTSVYNSELAMLRSLSPGSSPNHATELANWFYFPWSKSLVRYPGGKDLRELRVARNRDLINSSEQDKLAAATIAVFGLSVGSNVVENLVRTGIGSNFILGDMDILTPTNLNRMSATPQSLGENKVHWISKYISTVDPYVNQTHLTDGADRPGLEALAASDSPPDVIFDEVDDLAIKVAIRDVAKTNKIPVVMVTDVADTVLLDVERYDLTEGTKAFNGRLSRQQLEAIRAGALQEPERRRLLIKLIGPRHLTTRMVNSALDINQRLTGMPQLGTTAAIGGAVASIAAREILVGRHFPSGRRVVSMHKTLSLQASSSRGEALHAIRRLIRER